MNRLRMATWAAIAGVGLLSGCQSSRNGSCEGGGGGLFNREGGLMSRLGLRKHNGNGGVLLPGTVVGAPITGVPLSGDPCPGVVTEGPLLEMPPHGAPPLGTAPGVLPSPTPLGTGTPPLAPVPGGGLAPETPAPPSAMSRRRS